VVSSLTGLPSRLPVAYILLAVFFSAMVGVFFGLYPANRASRLTPVQAMGFEK
jgi:putative ABC transport system permease protein